MSLSMSAGPSAQFIPTDNSGTCAIEDPTTLNCTGMKIAPPKCTCRSGGIVTIRFIAKALDPTHGIEGGVAPHDMTPVPYHIPSYLNPQANVVDLPLCAKSQASTKAHPCVHGS